MAGNILLSNGTGRIATIALNQQMFPVFLGLLLAAAVAWIFLSKRLYAELRQNHPGLYETLGSPRFFMHNSITANFRVIRFLLRQEYEATGDPAVIRLGRGLRSLIYMYAVCLAACLVLLFDKSG